MIFMIGVIITAVGIVAGLDGAKAKKELWVSVATMLVIVGVIMMAVSLAIFSWSHLP